MNIPKLKNFKPVDFVTEITYCDNKYGCQDLVYEGFNLSINRPGDLEHYSIETEPRRGWDVFNQIFIKDYPVYISADAKIKEVFNGQVLFEGVFADIQYNSKMLKKYHLDGVTTNEILLRNIQQIEKEFWQQEMENRENQMEERE